MSVDVTKSGILTAVMAELTWLKLNHVPYSMTINIQ